MIAPPVLDFENLLDHVPDTSFSSIFLRYIQGYVTYFRHCIFRTGRKAAHFHNRQVRNVITHVKYLSRLDPVFFQKFVELVHFIMGPQVDVRNTQPFKSPFDGRVVSPRNNADFVTSSDGHFQGLATFDVHRAHQFSIGKNGHGTIGQHPVNVEYKGGDLGHYFFIVLFHLIWN